MFYVYVVDLVLKEGLFDVLFYMFSFDMMVMDCSVDFCEDLY